MCAQKKLDDPTGLVLEQIDIFHKGNNWLEARKQEQWDAYSRDLASWQQTAAAMRAAASAAAMRGEVGFYQHPIRPAPTAPVSPSPPHQEYTSSMRRQCADHIISINKLMVDIALYHSPAHSHMTVASRAFARHTVQEVSMIVIEELVSIGYAMSWSHHLLHTHYHAALHLLADETNGSFRAVAKAILAASLLYSTPANATMTGFMSCIAATGPHYHLGGGGSGSNVSEAIRLAQELEHCEPANQGEWERGIEQMSKRTPFQDAGDVSASDLVWSQLRQAMSVTDIHWLLSSPIGAFSV